MLNVLIVSTNNITVDNRLLKNISLLKEKKDIDVFGLNTKEELIRNNNKIWKIFDFSFTEYIKKQKFFKKYLIICIIKIFFLRRLFILFKYSTYIKKNTKFSKYSHIWLQDFDCAILYFFLKKKINFKKVIFDAHELYQYSIIRNTKYKKIASFFVKLIFKIFLKKVDLFITINDSLLKFYKFHYKFTKSCDFVVLNNSVLINTKTDIYRNNFSLKKKLNIKKNKKILLYSGIIHPWRGINLLFELAKILNNKNFVIVIIGFGSHYNFYKSKIFEEKIDNIIIHESLPYSELPYWFEDAYLGTMLFQNIDLNHQLCAPNKLWEYASASVPFISFNEFTEIKKFDEEYNIGFFVKANDTVGKISSFIENIKDDEMKEKKTNLKLFINSTDYKIQFNKIVEIINNHHV